MPSAATIDREPSTSESVIARLKLWRNWVLANVMGEVVGFGLAAMIGVAAIQMIEPLAGVTLIAAVVVAVIAVGVVEGGAVGLAQWLVLRGPLPGISAGAWLSATVAGAVLAWSLGMAVGTRASDWVGDNTVEVSPFLGAIVIGLAGGTLLSLFQWLVLRRAVDRAGWWVPAHAAGWAIGMVVAFAGLGAVQDEAMIVTVVVVGGTTGLAMGAVVAALTGLVLVWLLAHAR